MRWLSSSALLLGLGLAVFGLTGDRRVDDLVMAEGDRCDVDSRFVLCLDKFEVLRYPSGKIRQYESTVKVLDRENKALSRAVISVNHPLRLGDWWIYQYECGPDQTGALCTSLKCVSDLRLPFAALGGVLLLLGALAGCWPALTLGKAGGPVRRGARLGGWVAAILVVSIPLFIVGRAVLRPEPVPALQSGLMIPHVAAYVASYLLLLFAVFGIGRRFVPFGFLLMTLGLVLGAAWGKIAWSDWWQFDPKENWSFLTWFAYALALRCPAGSRAAVWLERLGAVLILVTLTWVNFSRVFVGLHSYAQ